MENYNQTDALRISADIWDNQNDIDLPFLRWEMYTGENYDFALDLDMIPFGYLLSQNRPDSLNTQQKLTFIAQRAQAVKLLM